MPSPESEAQANLFEALSATMASAPSLDILGVRALLDIFHVLSSEPEDVTYGDVQVGSVPCLWIKPSVHSSEKVILYTHGGGFMGGSPTSHRKFAGHLASSVGCRLLLPNYRKTPDHPFPAQLEDTVACYEYLLGKGYKPGNIAFAGDSAGGNLATSTTLKLKQDGKPLPAAVVGFSPWYDMEANGPTLDSNAKTDKLVQKPLIGNMIAALQLKDPKDPLANPLYGDLTGMPPMYLVAGTVEALEDNVDRLAEKAKKAGVDITVEKSEGMQHVYVFMAGKAPEADATLANVAKWLKTKMGKAS